MDATLPSAVATRLRDLAGAVDDAVSRVGVARLALAWAVVALGAALVGGRPTAGGEFDQFARAIDAALAGRAPVASPPSDPPGGEIVVVVPPEGVTLLLHPFLFLLLPVAWLAGERPLLVLQALALGWAVVPLDRLVRDVFDGRLASVLVVAYLLSPAVLFAVAPLHPLAFFPLLAFWMLDRYRRGQIRRYWTALLPALALGPSAALVLAPVGLVLWYDQRETNRFAPGGTRWALPAAGALRAGVVALLVAGGVVWALPGEAVASAPLLDGYAYLGETAVAVLAGALRDPAVLARRLVRPATAGYLVALLVPVAGAPLRTRFVVPVCGPPILLHALSTAGVHRAVVAPDQLPVVVGLLFCTALALADVPVDRRDAWLGAIVLGTGLTTVVVTAAGALGSVG